MLLASLATIAIIFILILVLGTLIKNNHAVDDVNDSSGITPYFDRVKGEVYPAITVLDNVTRVSLVRAVDSIMADAEAINWTGHNPGWTLLSTHTESGDVGGRSQYWEFVFTADTGVLIASVQEGKVVYTDISYTGVAQPSEAPNNGTQGDFSQVTGESGNGYIAVPGNRNPIDSTVIMRIVLDTYNMDANPYNTNFIIDYDGSARIYTVCYHDPADPAQSFTATFGGDTGNLISNTKGT